jgi:DNA-binding winged helix-turn-helix (wHTH) protein/tetratricopeptide (TPR) repeat protein
MSDKAANLLRFGDCELDLASREFRRSGELVPIEPRVFALLAFLFEHRDRAVDKDEIQDVVWKGTIVSETAMTRAIMKARRAVGDSAEKQAVIRTVHGHGYQFVAALVADDEPAAMSVATEGRDSRLPRIFAVVVVLVLGAFIVALWPASAPDEAVHIAVMPVNNTTGDADYDWTRLGLMGFANDLIEQSAVLNVLSASDVIRFAERNSLPDDDNGIASSFEELRDVYGASHMLVSRLEKNASVLRLSYDLYKPDGEIERGTMVGAEPAELMRGMIRSVGATLGDRSHGISEISVVSEDPFINEAYSRGLGLSLEGRCAEALELFAVVSTSTDTVGRADYEWAECARILGRWQDAEAGFKAILDKLPTEPSSSLRALALNGLGTVYIRTGRSDDARATYQLGLDEAQNAGDKLLQGMLLNSLAIDAKNRREFSEARELLARASLAHSEASSGIPPGKIPAAIANIDMAEGKLEQADLHLQEALSLFRAKGDRRNEAMMLNNFGYLRRLQNRVDDAEPFHLQSLEIRREIGDLVGQGRILGMLSNLYLDNGRLADARDAATEAYRIASEANDRLFMATGLAQLGNVERRAGDVQAARVSYTDSKEIFEQIGDHSRVAQVTLRLALLEFEDGNLESAEATVREVRTLSLREALQEPAIEAMQLEGDIARKQLDAERAISAYEDALQHIDETGFVAERSRVITKLANVFLDQQDFAAVEPLIGRMIEQGDESASLKLRARYAFLQGEVERAVTLQESARTASPDDWSDADETILLDYQKGRNPR